MTLPADIANQALDAVGIEVSIGDLEEGTRPAQVLLRAYRNCLRQLLRGVQWRFAKKTTTLQILGDVTGQTVGVGNVVQPPWRFCYGYPIDCARVIEIPLAGWNWSNTSNISLPAIPIMSGIESNLNYNRQEGTAPFDIGVEDSYPALPDPFGMQMPPGRTVILTNHPRARLKYISVVTNPDQWDSLFRATFVAFLASEVVLALSKDKRIGMALRMQQITIAKEHLGAARAANGNEVPTSSDLPVDWMRARTGLGVYGRLAGPAGYDPVAFCDGSVFA